VSLFVAPKRPADEEKIDLLEIGEGRGRGPGCSCPYASMGPPIGACRNLQAAQPSCCSSPVTIATLSHRVLHGITRPAPLGGALFRSKS
jgi:hypothetical protein